MNVLHHIQSSCSRLLLALALSLSLATYTGLHAQGITTAGISGFVTNASGSPIGGATVEVTHVPSGTKSTAVTRSNGGYSFAGLRVGGPYTVTATSGGLSGDSTGIILEPGGNADASIALGGEVVQLEAFGVTSSRDLTFASGKMGTSSNYDATAISNTTSVRNSIQDIARLDSRIYLGSLDQGGQLSAQGQNFRFNSFLIDGVQANDPYGINSNGFPSLASPIPLQSLETVSVQLNPYDVRYAGFTGALINAIVKSGTNSFEGTSYYQYSNDGLRAKNPVTGVKESFDEKNFGINITGPIIPNRLFFAFTYDKVERETLPPQPNFVPDAAGLVLINSIIARAKTLGYDAGSLTGPSVNLGEQETYIGKIDWNISSDHRLAVTYRRNYGQTPNFANYASTTSTSLSNHWFDQPRNTDSYNAQLNSDWTPDFRTEATFSYSEYDGSPSNRGAAFPMVQVQGISGTRFDTKANVNGNVFFGTENSRQLNFITTVEKQIKLSGEYSLGAHTLTFGGEDVITDYSNAFVQNTMGNYTFASTAAWLAGTPPSAYQLQKPFPGRTIQDAVANWTYDAYAGFIQDKWQPTPRLTIVAGLRYDYPSVADKPPVANGFANAGFRSDNGRVLTDNTVTNDGNATLAPRIGFNYELPEKRKTQLRGGFGLFQGKNPAVWLTNSFQNAGSVYNYTASSSELPNIVFNPNPNTQTVPGTANPSPNINLTDADYKMPALWKSNIAIDHELPFGGIIFSAEYYHNITESAPNTEFLNYAVSTDGNGTGRTPDGRIRYGPAAAIVSSTTSNVNGRRRVAGFADVFYFTNTSKGRSRGFTLSLNRPMKNNWAWSASWTNADATEVSPITSSTASSNYSNRAVFNPNENIASTSNTSIRDNIILSLTRKFEFVKRAPTTVSMVYIVRSGHPYSWVFYGDANGDGYTFNDLLYVPTGPSDPKVAWADAAQRDAFFAFVENTSLKNYKGTNPSRNSETSPWLQTLDLKVTQAIPLFRNLRAELFANVLNFGNLLNKDWGIQEEVPFSFRRAVAGATYNAAGNGGQGVWNYNFTSTTLNGVPVTSDETPVSRWQAQLGIRLKF